ncbi:putative 2OG-Fe(II) oxygenase [Novilysobacter erysipheiresistens]
MVSTGAPQALSADQSRRLETALRVVRQGDHAGALEIARRVVAEAASAPDGHQSLAMILSEAGDATQAEAAFRQALQLAPAHPLILVNYAAFLRKFNRPAEALGVLRRAVDVQPGFAKAWIDLGLTALGLGQSGQALDALERAVRLQPESVLAWHALGNARRRTDDLEGADAAFSRAVELNPGYAAAWVNLGAVRRLSGQPGSAVACFEKAMQAGYSGPDLADALAGALLDDGQPSAALERARTVTRNHPEFVGGHATLANILWEHGPALEPGCDPMEEFRATVRARPNDLALGLAFARMLLSARMADEALQQVRRLRTQSDHVAFATLEAEVLQSQGRTEQAGALYARLQDTALGRDPGFLNTHARHLLIAGRYEAAAERADEATRIDPDNQTGWAYLATAWRMLDDPREFWLCDYDTLASLEAIDPPARFADQDGFLKALAAILEPMHLARREPVQQSLRGGSQTPGRLFGRGDPVLQATQVALRDAIDRWLAKLPSDDSHPFLRRKARTVRFGGSWSVRLWSSGSHANHVHQEGWMSSAFYVSLPPSVRSPPPGNPAAGYLQLGQPPVELGLDLPPRRVIRPEPGKLALFPSYLWHGTVPFEDTIPRLSIAFDMTPLDRHP